MTFKFVAWFLRQVLSVKGVEGAGSGGSKWESRFLEDETSLLGVSKMWSGWSVGLGESSVDNTDWWSPWSMGQWYHPLPLTEA